MNNDTGSRHLSLAATPHLLEQAIADSSLLICDMRPAADSLVAPIRRAVYLQANEDCAVLLRALLGCKTEDILLVTTTSQVINDIAWLQSHSDRVVHFQDAERYPPTHSCLDTDAPVAVAAEMLADLNDFHAHLEIIDLREQAIYDRMHIAGSQNIALRSCWEYISILDHDRTFYVYGTDDAEALCFTRLMQFWGYRNMIPVLGGFGAIERNGRFYMAGNE